VAIAQGRLSSFSFFFSFNHLWIFNPCGLTLNPLQRKPPTGSFTYLPDNKRLQTFTFESKRLKYDYHLTVITPLPSQSDIGKQHDLY
jgi:hypothetical protein